MRRSSLRHAAGSRHRGLGLALVLGPLAAIVAVGVALACTNRGDAACGPVRFQAAPSSLNVGIQIGSTCLEPGTTDYAVTLSGPNGFSQVIAQGSVSPPNPIVPQSVFAVPTAGRYILTYTTTTNRGESQECVTGTTELMVEVPSGVKPTQAPTPTPTLSPSPAPTEEVTPKPTNEPTATEQITETPTEEVVTEAPSEQPGESASEAPATFESSPSVGSAGPGASGGAGGGGGGGGPDFITVGLVGLIIVGGIGAAIAVLLYIRSGQAANAPWKAGPWKCARCNAINREGTDHCRRCYARWDGTA